jgi:hypothetical protein
MTKYNILKQIENDINNHSHRFEMIILAMQMLIIFNKIIIFVIFGMNKSS